VLLLLGQSTRRVSLGPIVVEVEIEIVEVVGDEVMSADEVDLAAEARDVLDAALDG